MSGAGGSRPYSRGHLYRILSNLLYIGRIPHKDQTFPGNHPPIIEMDLWHAVQERLKANRQGDKVKAHASNPSILAGLVFDERGERLTASHAKKRAKRYRYYIGTQDPSDQDQDVVRIPANELEGLVSQAVQAWLNDGSKVMQAMSSGSARETQDRIEKARALAGKIKESLRLHLAGCIRRITVGPDRVRIALNPAALGVAEGLGAADEDPPVNEVSVKLGRCGMAVRLIVNTTEAGSRRTPDATLIALLAKAHDWFGELTSGRIESVAALASKEQVSAGYATRLIHLALMAPDIVERIVRGEHPPQLTAAKLMQWMPLSQDWSEQRRMLGFG
ncbi:MAG: recombinase family protein [Proteobacteria bacterium]|nr:recombinase family protein [Pseudomonadota bacterium]